MDITIDTDFWKMRVTSLSSLLSTVGCSLSLSFAEQYAIDSLSMDGWMDCLCGWERVILVALTIWKIFRLELRKILKMSSWFYKRCWLTARMSEIDNGTHGTQYDRIANCGMIGSTVETIDIQQQQQQKTERNTEYLYIRDTKRERGKKRNTDHDFSYLFLSFFFKTQQ